MMQRTHVPEAHQEERVIMHQILSTYVVTAEMKGVERGILIGTRMGIEIEGRRGTDMAMERGVGTEIGAGTEEEENTQDRGITMTKMAEQEVTETLQGTEES